MSHLSINGNWDKDIDDLQRKTMLIEEKRLLEPSLKASQHFTAGQRRIRLERRNRKRGFRGKLGVSKWGGRV